jgi:hypothetical protein
VAFWKDLESPPTRRGLGPSYEKLPPFSAYNIVAYFLRQCFSFFDAVQKWKVENPDARIVRDLGLFKQAKKSKGECAKKITAALGRYHEDYDAAEEAIHEWIRYARSEAGLDPVTGEGSFRPEFVPLVNTLGEIKSLRTVLEAYRNPTMFFREIAPRLYPEDFRFPRRDWPSANERRLSSTLRTWGHGVHLNPNVQAALAIAATAPRMFARILGVVEQRKAYNEGRGKGVRDGTTSKRRVSHEKRRRKIELRIERGMSEEEAAQDLARREGRSMSAIRKSRVIARKREKAKSPN